MSSPGSTNVPEENNLSRFSSELATILQDAGHNEMYGVKLEAPADEYGIDTLSCGLLN